MPYVLASERLLEMSLPYVLQALASMSVGNAEMGMSLWKYDNFSEILVVE